MLSDVIRKKGLVTGTLKKQNRNAAREFRGGRWLVNEAQVEEAVEFFTVPDNVNFFKVMETEGAQTLDNRHFYFPNLSIDIKNKDKIEYEGTEYEIRGYEPRPEGNFLYAYGMSISRG